MNKFTLSIIFNKERTKVLMCWHLKQEAWNFIGGKIKDGEDAKEASYRELFEETGISKEDVQLLKVREERVYLSEYLNTEPWYMYVTYGVLEKDVTFHWGENPVMWVNIDDKNIDSRTMHPGSCRLYLNEALTLLRSE